MLHGYDQNQIKRLWASDRKQAAIMAREYFAQRPDCREIRWYHVDQDGAFLAWPDQPIITRRF